MRRDDLCHEIRQCLVRLPSPYDAHYGIVPPPLPEEAISLGQAVRKVEAAMAALGRVEAMTTDLKDPYRVSRILTRREAVASSSIEGTHSTLDELLTVEENQDEERATVAKQVRSYALALDEIVPQMRQAGPEAFSTELISRLHQRTMRDDLDYKDIPGELRCRVVWIGGGGSGDIAYSTYNPPPPDQVKVCLTALVEYMRCQGMQVMTQGMLTRMAMAHAQFEAIHPFRDGNGRVGRLLIPLMMAADGRVPLYLSPFIESKKADYYAALKTAQQRLQFGDLVEFFADAMIATVDELQATQSALKSLREAWLKRRKFRRDSAFYKALEWLPDYPVLTVARLAKILDLSFKTASVAIEQLMEAKILVERTGYARNRIFAATEVLSIINRPFGVEPILPRIEADDESMGYVTP